MKFDMNDNLAGFLAQKAERMVAGALEGVHDATDHLLATSRDIAPLDKGTLRMTSGREVTSGSGRVYGEVFYSATETSRSGIRFNYALRVHEMGEYKNPTTPGTRPKFLSSPLQTNERLYQRFIADAIRRAMR
ncbi:HK97 gp10 family phage protein [Paenibacillus tengchongensis]|uniref:HK97 gp10 family phage protein n=1 Tax=Paenibacillus tengchongensis TaxID=2608684 RepID=UPI00124DE9E2|nr:HK97 gp10 family phage protein [Paenibacillus tengchongensis]